jgi:glycosyltransferase involved in cell wall biosynthesis
MKICMLVFGAIDYSVALCFALSEYCDVDLYIGTYHLNEADPSILHVLGGKVKVFTYTDYRNRDVRNLFVYRDLWTAIEERHYDIIHFQEYGPPWAIPSWRVCKRVPTVMTVHDPYQHGGLPVLLKVYQEVLQRLFVSKAWKVIVHGTLLREHVLRLYSNKSSDDVIALPHGDFSILKHWDECDISATELTKTILFFGYIRRNKGLDYLLQAEPIIRQSLSDFRIVIAGKCDEWDRYAKLIQSGAKITVINDFIPNKSVPRYFREASLVVLPYLSATQSGVIALAYSFGKPVVASRVGSIPEVVKEGETGLLVEPANTEALAEAIVRLLSDENLLTEMGKNAARYCEEHLAWPVIARKTIEYYKGMLK